MKIDKLVCIAASCVLPLLAWPAAAQSPELVLLENTQLTANTKSGSITVEAGEGLSRSYHWNGCRFGESMSISPRSERWFGAKGLTGSGGGSLFGGLFGCKGVSRPLVSEAQMHFPTTGAALKWLTRYARHRDTVWTNDGLIVQWHVSPQRYQINVDVWQLCVGGRRPTQLAGASDDAIQVTRASGTGSTRQDCAQVDLATQKQTEQIWTAHYMQSDAMNAALARPLYPDAGKVARLEFGANNTVTQPERIKDFIDTLRKLPTRWKPTKDEMPTPQAVVNLVDATGLVLCTVWVGADWLQSQCGRGDKGRSLLAPLEPGQLNYLKEFAGRQ